MRINGNLSLAEICMHISHGDNAFYLYLRGSESYETVLIEAYDDTDFVNITPMTFMRYKLVYFKDELLSLGELYDKFSKRGHFFFFDNHLRDYVELRENINIS